MSNRLHLLPLIARVLLGLIFFVFGLNGFLGFLPQPPLPEGAGAFIGSLIATGYLFPLLKGTEVLAGALLLSNRFVPLALTLLAPILVNIVAFHALLAGGGLGLPLVLLAPVVVNIAAFHLRFTPAQVGLSLAILALELFLAWSYRAAFAPMLSAAATPTLVRPAQELVGASVA